jgi:hypothetical protein
MQRKSFALARAGLALALVTVTGWVNSQSPTENETSKEHNKETKCSVSINEAKAFKGYTLLAPLNSKKTHLIDMEGHVVHSWESDCMPALVTYLLDNGNLLRTGNANAGFSPPGFGGRVQEYSWDGKLLWDYTHKGKDQRLHHDITRLPNGNILMIISDRKNRADALAAGRRPETVRELFSTDGIVEVKPTGPTSGEIVWEWHVWDHLVQDHDKNKPNFGKISTRAERVDINFAMSLTGKPMPSSPADFTHFNSVDYNAELDQIMISLRHFSEIWIIDHSTTKAEAATSKGGKSGKGGDLLYRWGNPMAYKSGTASDRRLFFQHNAHWIPKDLPGAGNVLIFNNGLRQSDRDYSSVDEIVLPQYKDGSYERRPENPFGPTMPTWSYTAPTKTEFFAGFISGAQRLPNGNTLICSGNASVVFEVTPQMEVVWKFTTPAKSHGELFRSYRFGVDHPALKGRELTPGKKIEDL